MRIDQVHIENYSCLDDVTLDFDDVTVLLGPNSTGKSSVLHAIRWFFDGGDLVLEDVGGACTDDRVSVAVSFSDFSDADRAAFGAYVIDGSMTLWRTWSQGEGGKLTGHGLAFPPFEAVRSFERASDLNQAYRQLRADQPDLDLPVERSADGARAAMADWEARHPEALVESTVSATNLFGFVGHGKLAGRFDFVLVPAVSDVESETRNARGTLLQQLVQRAGGHSAEMQEKVAKLEEDVASSLDEIAREDGGKALEDLAAAGTRELNALVPAGKVTLDTEIPAVQIPSFGVSMRVGDGGLDTTVGRQGHGFQRALLLALIRQLSRDEHAGDPPGLFLALEEPELFQHPVQARHFAQSLAKLPRRGTGAIQVAYATHSEHFVDSSHFERLRRFGKVADQRSWPTARVTSTTVGRVVSSLAGVVAADQVALRVQMTLRRQLAEAVFASAVLLVEGRSDAGFLHGVADRFGGFDASGVSVVFGMGKRQLLLPRAILDQLGVPNFVVFDGDAALADRLAGNGQPPNAVDAAVRDQQATNNMFLGALGAEPLDQPLTAVARTYAVMEDRLETEYQAWPEFVLELDGAREAIGDWRDKSEDAYRLAAGTAKSDPPAFFVRIVEAVLALASPQPAGSTP